MKKNFLAALSFLVITIMATSCLKNDNNYTNIVQPEAQKDTIQKFIATKGYNMVEYKPDGQSTGIMYEIVDNGNNNGYGDTTNFRPTQEKRFVTVAYTGQLLNGNVFDEATTASPGKFPIYQVYSNGQVGLAVIPAFAEMVTKIGKGGHIRFVTPSYYAYMNNASAKIPANSPLFFDIQLMDVTAQ